MCKIKTGKWAECNCPIRDVPIKCREDVQDPYTCPDVQWEEGSILPSHYSCKVQTPSGSEASSDTGSS
jgi:hypothetical protein